ncbi:MAG: YggS family pyridoxal phosphate-dependent enzyme [Bacteriovoracia bacterium]
MSRTELYQEKLENLKEELKDTSLLIVSKTRSLDEIKTYYQLGHRDFGENRVQELSDKAIALQDECPEIRWHMIGHLQSNKINALFAVPNLFAIHSVHDRSLVEKLIHAEDKLGHELCIFLQFNTSHEEEKSGFETYTDLRTSAELLLKCKKLKLTGLMTMGTLRTENFEAEAGRCFQDLRVEKEKLENEFNIKLKTSMGMSQDYKIAIREKSDWVRLGTMMFT